MAVLAAVMPVDQGEIERQRVLAYGGSDDTRTSFNRSRYTVHASKGDPKDLGEHSSTEITIKGEIGAENGSQTLFFRFRTTEEARVEVRGVRINRYTDQYISLDLRDGSGRALTLEQLSGDVVEDSVALAGLGIPTGYVTCGYWETGYAELDCALAPAAGIRVEPKGMDLYYERIGATASAGTYDLVVSTSQWTRLPYELRVIVDPLVVALSGEAAVEVEATGRLALAAPAGEALISMPASGRLIETRLLQGEASAAVPATGRLDRTSPFG